MDMNKDPWTGLKYKVIILIIISNFNRLKIENHLKNDIGFGSLIYLKHEFKIIQ